MTWFSDKIPYDILDEYLKQDVELTYKVFNEQKGMIQGKERLISLHNQDLLVLQDMEYNGLQYEYDRSLILGNELDEQISKLNKKLHDYHAYDSFNPNSGEHLSAFLYGGNIKERFQQPIGHYKTGTRTGEVKYKWEERLVEFPRRFEPLEGTELKKEGFYSTNDDTLKRLQGSEESMKILTILLTRATLEKRRGTYYIGVPALIDTMGWTNNLIHGQLNQCVAKTGRLSSSKPNLQNFDGEIKSLFTTRYGETI